MNGRRFAQLDYLRYYFQMRFHVMYKTIAMLLFIVSLTACEGESASSGTAVEGQQNLRETTASEKAESSDQEVDVEAFIRSRFGETLFAERDPLPQGGGIGDALTRPPSTPNFDLPTGSSPLEHDAGSRYLDTLPSDETAFSLANKRPPLEANRDDCTLSARIISLEVGEAVRKDAYVTEHSFTVTQELLVDLYRIRSPTDLEEAIGWDDATFHDARKKARRLPAEVRADIAEQWQATHASRGAVMELVHPAGSTWTMTGKVRVRETDSGGDIGLRQLNATERPTLSLVTREFFPPNILAVDPGNYTAIADEWTRPFRELIEAIETAHETEVDATNSREKHQLTVFKNVIRPDKQWTTVVSGSEISASLIVAIETVDEKGMFTGSLHLDTGERDETFSVFGFPSTFRESDIDEHRPNVTYEMFGHAYIIQPTEPASLREPWSELQMTWLVAPDSDVPTLVWLNIVKDMQRVD